MSYPRRNRKSRVTQSVSNRGPRKCVTITKGRRRRAHAEVPCFLKGNRTRRMPQWKSLLWKDHSFRRDDSKIDKVAALKRSAALRMQAFLPRLTAFSGHNGDLEISDPVRHCCPRCIMRLAWCGETLVPLASVNPHLHRPFRRARRRVSEEPFNKLVTRCFANSSFNYSYAIVWT